MDCGEIEWAERRGPVYPSRPQAVAEWRAKALPAGDPVCYRNLTTSIMFVLER